MEWAAILALALVLDALLGEPVWLWSRLPHPAVLMGRAIGWADARFNTADRQKRNGICVVAGLVLIAGAVGLVLSQLGWVAEALVAAILLAQRSLVDHVRAVADGLARSVEDGRAAVAMIVGRDTREMDGPAVARAAIESAAENFSDGVVAPAFWFLIAGLPGLLIYKVVNTADSMIGYRTPRHLAFGWAAARLDDVLNWVPARLSAVLISLSHGKLRIWRAVRQDARLHRSPNAGWPEAAMAQVLNVALSGPRGYDGQREAFPFVNPTGARDIGAAQIADACDALWRSWSVGMGAVLLLALL
ncbi:adenosylcobinamide-phosphate synthase CbiB [Tropicimonas sp. S265A]|uniref:adenosylcobinamide-phosphate synthase CbiB n=1 Tax=Tropicimonas sp. S265A TaxID=3415134 RepID=UPI003C7CB868